MNYTINNIEFWLDANNYGHQIVVYKIYEEKKQKYINEKAFIVKI